MNLKVYVEQKGEFTVAIVELRAGFSGIGTSRKQDNAIAYALEDLAKKLLEPVK